jgi:osmoprotectant transport system ATP-binding protein
MLTSRHGGAIVCGDRDQYLGIVDFDSVTDRMRLVEHEVALAREATS